MNCVHCLRCLAAVLLLAGFNFQAAALEGEQDYAFGPLDSEGTGTGYVESSGADLENIEWGNVAVETTGRFLAVGKNLIIRWSPDGTRDPSFDGDGILSALPPGGDWSNFLFTALGVQGDGKILAAGTLRDLGASGQCRVFRCLSNGVPDTSFGEQGWAHSGLPEDENLAVLAVLPVSSGRTLVLTNKFVFRLTAGGQLDGAFGTAGVSSLEGMYPGYLAVLQDGKILVGGGSRVGWQYALWRFSADGILDEAFGTGGEVVTSFASVFDGALRLLAMQVQPDGKIYAAGFRYFQGGVKPRFAAARWLPDGTPDETYGEAGQLTGDEMPLFPEGARLHGNGSVDFAGAVTLPYRGAPNSYDRLAAARFSGEGKPARPVPGGGLSVLHYTESGASSWGAFVIPAGDGGIFVLGNKYNGGAHALLARFLGPDAPPGVLKLEYPPGTELLRNAVIDLGTIPPQRYLTGISFVLRNTGAGQLTGLETKLLPGGPLSFYSDPPLPVLLGGDTFAFDRGFFVATSGPFSQQLEFRCREPDAVPYLITLKGVILSRVELIPGDSGPGEPFTATTLDFGKVVPGDSKSFTFRLRNGSPFQHELLRVELVNAAPGFKINHRTDPLYANFYNVASEQTTASFSVNFARQDFTEPATAILRLIADSPEKYFVDLNLTVRPPTAFDLWRRLYFYAMEPVGDGAHEADPDGDGVPNLVEYAVNTDPARRSSPPGELTLNGDRLEYRLVRTVETAPLLDYSLEWSDNLAGGWSAEGLVVTATPLAGQREKATLSVPAGTGKRFVRLRVTLKP